MLTVIALCVGIPVGIYLVMSNPLAQDKLRNIGEEELTKLLGTQVTIGKIDIAPFNRLRITDVRVADDNGKTALRIGHTSARFELEHFLATGHIVIDYVALDDVDVHLSKASTNARLNIDGIIKKLTEKKPDQKPKRFSLAISTVIINKGALHYDVGGTERTPGRFNAAHIAVSDISLYATLPKIADTCISVEVERLSLRESAGFTLDCLTAEVTYTPSYINVSNLAIDLPNSHLAFAPLEVKYGNGETLKLVGRTIPVNVSLRDNSYIRPADLAAFVPALNGLSTSYNIGLDVEGTTQDVRLNKLTIKDFDKTISITATGVASNVRSLDSLVVEQASVKARATGSSIAAILEAFNASVPAQLQTLGAAEVTVEASGSAERFLADVDVRTGIGNVGAEISASKVAKAWSLAGAADIRTLDLKKIVPKSEIHNLDADLNFEATLAGRKLTSGAVDLDVSKLVYRTTEIKNLSLTAEGNPEDFTAHLYFPPQRLGAADLNVEAALGKHQRVKAFGVIRDLNTAVFASGNPGRQYTVSANINAEVQGNIHSWVDGFAEVTSAKVVATDSTDKKTLKMSSLRVDLSDKGRNREVNVSGDWINGRAVGHIVPQRLAADIRNTVACVMPVLIPGAGHVHDAEANNFNFSFELSDLDKPLAFLNAGVVPAYPITVDGKIDAADCSLDLSVDAPYLIQGDKIIENTVLQADVNGHADNAQLYVTSSFPTQKGPATIVGDLTMAANRVDTKIDWRIDRQNPIKGLISASTLLGRDDNGKMTAEVQINPGDITFGEDVWRIAPSTINYRPGDISVTGFNMRAGNQSIAIDGRASNSLDDQLTVMLQNIQTLSIFETLNIDKALIGGSATGQIVARNLFGSAPDLHCDNLHVDSISYNRCVLGTGDIRAFWDNERQAVNLDALVVNHEGKKSTIRGDIFATREALDITIEADSVRVGFMKPFMSAFAEDLTGRASGRAHLFGTFKNIDLDGRIKAYNLGLKIAFTNTWYYATDSVVIDPGIIRIPNITIKDRYGHTAQVDGVVTHKYFHDPTFDFRITDARNMLVYDVTPKLSPDWYGRIFGNGGGVIRGEPGFVGIDVGMSTAPGSTFTFVLSDNLQADEYTFLTFRNRNAAVESDAILDADPLPSAVRAVLTELQARAAAEDGPSRYLMDIKVDITPEAAINLVMDPVGGDEIKSHGTGNMRLTYETPGDELHLYGNYTIDRGSYNFTLQDIIVKDFTIENGSSIRFTGDPYAADLNIRAVYPVNANLSDLDESFLQDKDLNRTNVPVNAVLMANGDMRQPEISFDLEFPTLNSDVYRKVRSIVSTEEMMNRQIIYLLALNRFYTPEYMSTTKGNELFSVASSTIAGQLTNMLGKLADNWSIAPNLRSDRGDFSDVEVDVALSSSLLNNRLRLNGNFGYRDKSLNTNQFIGDFDIEYLLNRRGTWRLKAYNRYNDQNYYLRSAQTTQGLGIMFKRDFDGMFNFLKPKRNSVDTTPADTLKTDTLQWKPSKP